MDDTDIVFLSFFGFIFILGTTGNICILAALSKMRQHRRLTHLLMINQAVSDLCLVAISLPLRIARMCVKKSLFKSSVISSDLYCRITAGTNVVFLGASCFGLLLMTLDKFLAVRFPLSYRTGIDKRHFIAPVLLTWFVPAVIGCCGVFVTAIHENIDEHGHDIACLYGSIFKETYALFVYVLTLIIPLIMIFPMYIYILKKVKSSWKFVIPNNSENCLKDQLPGIASSRRVKDVNTFRKKEIRLAKGIFLILGIHLMCLAPVVVLDFFHIILHRPIMHIAVEICLGILYLNAVLDPPIYARHSTEIKETMLRFLLYCRGQRHGENLFNKRRPQRRRGVIQPPWPITDQLNQTYVNSINESGNATENNKQTTKGSYQVSVESN